MLKIDIVSGFLGAGKTTYIKRLLGTELKNEKIVLIENEFGEISVDSMFLSESKIDIAELSQGCICCSLVGDFAKSLNEVIEKYHPDRIIVEPSGVGKLSDVIKAIEDAGLSEHLNTYICIVDASKAKVYSKNFKEFFNDQIAHAKTVVLSRCDILSEEKIESAIHVVRHINANCNLVTTPLSELSDLEVLKIYEGNNQSLLDELFDEQEEHNHGECCCGGHHEHHHHHHHHEECGCGEHHEHHHHEECSCGEHHEHEHHHHEGCGCGDHHHADEVFSSVTIETAKVFCYEKLHSVLHELAYTNNHGQIIRAKGILKTTEGWKVFNITPEELVVEDSFAFSIGSLCVIGVELDKEEIKKLF